MQESSQSVDPRSVLVKYVANILGRRPYFRHQIRQKLFIYAEKKDLVVESKLVDEIISDLAKSGYLDDEYLAGAYVRRQLQKCYGPHVISYKLRQLGLSSSQINQALKSEINDDIIAQITDKIRLKYHCEDPRKLRQKLYQRGFSGVQSIN